MTRDFLHIALFAALLVIVAGCSTMSRTEKQLSKVDSFESPDIPSLGAIPPLRPQETGLMYSPNVLVVSYDMEVGKDPLKKAIHKYGASIIYDYRIINAIAIRIPDNKELEDAITHFEKVKGVLQVSKDRVYHLDDPVRPVMEVK
ncbi:MAG: hypothetical protein IK076_01295 [Bacteroidales bacterium]|nr:hypothetical protein [Bacteroidales bacterium]